MSEQQPAPPNSTTAQLLQLVAGLDEYTPVVPDQLVQHVLRTTGYNCTDPAILRLLAAAGQHFLVQVCADALQLHKRRKSANKRVLEDAGIDPDSRDHMVLTMEDLLAALEEMGIHARRPAYYAS